MSTRLAKIKLVPNSAAMRATTVDTCKIEECPNQQNNDLPEISKGQKCSKLLSNDLLDPSKDQDNSKLMTNLRAMIHTKSKRQGTLWAMERNE